MSDLVSLPSLIFPAIQPRLQSVHGSLRIHDPIRRQYVALTPEEWVRQHCLAWLTSAHAYPAGRCSVERQVGSTGLRYDLLWVDADLRPFLLVECKAPSVAITADTLRQSAWYNITLAAPHVLLTNGLTAYCARVDRDGVVHMLDDVPSYPSSHR